MKDEITYIIVPVNQTEMVVMKRNETTKEEVPVFTGNVQECTTYIRLQEN
jgi:hypothetical protein